MPHLRTDLPPIGMPTLDPFVWTIAGHSAELAPLTHVLVVFADGDPSRPKVVGIDPTALPVSSSLDASTFINMGAAASFVLLNSGTYATWITQVTAAAATINPAIVAPTGHVSTKVKA